MNYLLVKEIHTILVYSSVILFVIRFLLSVMGVEWIKCLIFKLIPHMIDTVLLASGVMLAVYASFNPLQPHGKWLLYKLICVLFYIVFALIAMKVKSKLVRCACFLVSLGFVALAINIAITKSLPFAF